MTVITRITALQTPHLHKTQLEHLWNVHNGGPWVNIVFFFNTSLDLIMLMLLESYLCNHTKSQGYSAKPIERLQWKTQMKQAD